jgi:NTP pyrophosphatase (non-canonical NTP hydrolase)
VERFFIVKGLTFKIYNHIKELPNNWDDVAVSNVFLQTHYLEVLEKSAPTNMQCFYIGIFENQELIGVSLAQYLDLNKLESFGERDKCFKTFIRNFIFKNFASHTLFLGNNMITGQNGYAFSKKIDFKHISEILMETAKHVDFDKYAEFVDAVTSDASKDFLALSDRLVALDEKGANIERLLTAAVGINAEGGEFMEIVKKMIFQGKPYNEDNREHMIIELGDIMWYVAQACMALDTTLDDVVARNVQKLLKRYPEGAFDVYFSENRAADDR